MGSPLPTIPRTDFDTALTAVHPSLPAPARAALYAHYATLAAWNPRLSLVGPGTAEELVERHYLESLAALPLLPAGPFRLLDVGSGAGFPGLVLAVARPDAEVFLTEPRQRKWSFLKAASRAASRAATAAGGGALSCHILNARVESPPAPGVPTDVDVVTCRAVGISTDLLQPFANRTDLRFLLWRGSEPPPLPAGWEIRRETPLAGSARRRILDVRRRTPA